MKPSEEKAYDIMQGLQKLFNIMKPKQIIKSITPAAMMVMMSAYYLSNSKGYTTPSEISSELGMSKSALTFILNKLEHSGLIKRTLSSTDRRKFELTLTDSSKAILADYHKSIKKSVLSLMDDFGEKDTDEFLRLINKANNFYFND